MSGSPSNEFTKQVLDERLRSSDSLDVPEELRLRALVRG